MNKIKYIICSLLLTVSLPYISTGKSIITTHSVEVSGHNLVYNTAGKGDRSILFLHGLFANKEQWIPLMTYFADRGYFTVAPDLPGYGESNSFPLDVYTMPNQVKLLNSFVEKIGLKEFNIAGNSLGCTVSILYAQKFQQNVNTIALLGGPAGLGKWSEKIMDVYKKGKNPFIPLTIEDFNEEMSLLFYKPTKIPVENIREALKSYKDNYKKYVQIFNLFNMTVYNFSTSFKSDLKIPVLILWGKDDHILTSEDAELAQKKIPGSELIILDNAGHLIMIENTEKVAELYDDFLNK